MATLAFPYSVRDSANTSTDNRKTGLTATVSNGKTLAASPATVLASTVTVVEVGAGDYVALYDAEANGDASFPVDWGSGLTSPNDRYGTLILTRDAGRVIANLDAAVSTRSTFAGGAVASVTGNVGGSVGSVTAAVTVGGYSAGEDPATLTWAAATRTLTAGTNIVLAKGTGITGFNDIAATAIVSGGAITTSGGAVSTVTTATTTTNLTNLPAIPSNWITAAGITAAALNGKGDWTTTANVGAAVRDVDNTTPASGSLGAKVNSAASAGDPWATDLPGSYGAGTAGAIVGTNLDATVASRSTYAGADTAGTTTLLSRIGGAITLNAGAVTVGTNNDKTGYTASTVGDKTGYSLAPSGLDSITATEPVGPSSGWNFRQWLRWTAMRLVNASRTPSTLTVKTLAGATSTTQAVTDDGAGNETTGATS